MHVMILGEYRFQYVFAWYTVMVVIVSIKQPGLKLRQFMCTRI